MDVEIIDHVDRSQLGEIQELLDAARDHDGHLPLGEHKWLDLVHGGREGFAGVVVREPGHPHPVGYAQLSVHRSSEPISWGLELVVHPEHRGVGVEVTLLEQALRTAAEQGGGHLHLWVFQPTEIHEGLAHRFGLRRGRDLLHMRAPLPVDGEVSLPSGLRLRSFEPGRDDGAWLEANNRAFAHHPEQGAWSAETLRRRMAEPWFDPDGFLLVADDGAIAAFCWVKPDRDAGQGEIYVAGVDPDHQGGGLGKTVVTAGLRWMSEQSFERAVLYVDSANEQAVGLYQSMGFEVDHLDRAYVTDIEPA